jgi:hypothetical protein
MGARGGGNRGGATLLESFTYNFRLRRY